VVRLLRQAAREPAEPVSRPSPIPAGAGKSGVASAGARAIAEDAGLLHVEDRCLIIEPRRLGLEAAGR
jgi:hypothetical protein